MHGFVGTALPLIRLLCRQPSQRGLESAISAPNTAGAVIYAKDLSRVTAFYREVAVLPVTHSEIDYAILESETFQRVVHAIPAGIAASIDVASPPMRREDAAVKLIFPVPSIDASRALAAMHGGALNPPEREPEGTKFHDVNLRGADFADVALTGARIRNACLGEVSIADANYEGMRIGGILVTDFLRVYREHAGT